MKTTLTTGGDPVRDALTKLVAFKDMKDRLESLHAMGHGTDYTMYREQQPLAWGAARAALAQSTQAAEPLSDCLSSASSLEESMKPTLLFLCRPWYVWLALASISLTFYGLLNDWLISGILFSAMLFICLTDSGREKWFQYRALRPSHSPFAEGCVSATVCLLPVQLVLFFFHILPIYHGH